HVNGKPSGRYREKRTLVGCRLNETGSGIFLTLPLALAAIAIFLTFAQLLILSLNNFRLGGRVYRRAFHRCFFQDLPMVVGGRAHPGGGANGACAQRKADRRGVRRAGCLRDGKHDRGKWQAADREPRRWFLLRDGDQWGELY